MGKVYRLHGARLYRLCFDTRVVPLESSEPEDYVNDFTGRITSQDREDDGELEAGRFHVRLVHTAAAIDDGVDIFDVLDGDAELADYLPLLDHDGSLKRRLNLALHENFLIINRIELLPEHRSCGLGRGVILRLIGMFPGIGAVAAKPLALDCDPDGGWAGRGMPVAEMRREKSAAVLSYWDQLGFKRLTPDGPVYYLDPRQQLPRIADVVDPARVFVVRGAT